MNNSCLAVKPSHLELAMQYLEIWLRPEVPWANTPVVVFAMGLRCLQLRLQIDYVTLTVFL